MATSEKKGAGSLLKMLWGGVVVVVGVAVSVYFFEAFRTVVLGCLGPLLIFVGLVMVAIAKE